jgi:hypothetical protein
MAVQTFEFHLLVIVVLNVDCQWIIPSKYGTLPEVEVNPRWFIQREESI